MSAHVLVREQQTSAEQCAVAMVVPRLYDVATQLTLYSWWQPVGTVLVITFAVQMRFNCL